MPVTYDFYALDPVMKSERNELGYDKKEVRLIKEKPQLQCKRPINYLGRSWCGKWPAGHKATNISAGDNF